MLNYQGAEFEWKFQVCLFRSNSGKVTSLQQINWLFVGCHVGTSAQELWHSGWKYETTRQQWQVRHHTVESPVNSREAAGGGHKIDHLSLSTIFTWNFTGVEILKLFVILFLLPLTFRLPPRHTPLYITLFQPSWMTIERSRRAFNNLKNLSIIFCTRLLEGHQYKRAD